MTNQQDTWPAGATWVFQGTIAEDATAGTHVCSLTVTPGAGSEFQFLYGSILDGNTATAQAVVAQFDDGTNSITRFINNVSDTAQTLRNFPTNNTIAANTGTVYNGSPPSGMVSGSMRLLLQVTTAAVSVTQTFAIACRIKGAMPTAVLLDTIGTSTNTINTNKVF